MRETDKREHEKWGERWRMKADGPRDGGGGWGCRSWVGKGEEGWEEELGRGWTRGERGE
jgi:hypothetical protein